MIVYLLCCQVFQDVLGVSSFTGSDEAFAADALFLAYKEGSADRIKAALQVGIQIVQALKLSKVAVAAMSALGSHFPATALL